MAIFSDDKKIDELQTRNDKLRAQLKKCDDERRELAAKLAAANDRIEQLLAQLRAGQGEVERAQAAVRKARQRQRASVQRANRFKARAARD